MGPQRTAFRPVGHQPARRSGGIAACLQCGPCTKTGLNEYADSNNMIMLYPQTVATTVTPFNPNGCWDWWGCGSSHYADKQGPQIAAVRGMLTRLSANYLAGVPPLGMFGAPTGLAVGDKTHDRVALRWMPVSGSNSYMGLWAAAVSTQLRKVGASYYVGTCS